MTSYCLTIMLLLFSTISLPVNSPVASTLGSLLASLPGVSVVSEVDTYSLTQVRYSDLNLVIPIAVLMLAILVLRNSKRVLRLRIKAIPVGLLVFSTVAGFSACLFHEYVEALKLAVYVLIAVSYLTFDDSEKGQILDALVIMCFVAGIANAVITIWQYGSMSGWAFTPDTIRRYRPDGMFGDSIISALFCSLSIAVALLLDSKVPRLVRVVTTALCLVAGVVTGARSFYYLLAIVVVYLLLAKTADVPLREKTVLLLAVIAVVFIAVSPVGQSLIDSLTVQESVSSRELKQQFALEQFRSSPILGIGTGQYAKVEAALSLPTNLGLHGTNPHNVYLQVLCENGLVGFIPLMASTIGLLILSLRSRNSLILILLLLYLAIAWSLGILYSAAFTSFFVAFFCGLTSERDEC